MPVARGNCDREACAEGEAEAEGGDVEMTDGAPDTVTDACAAHVLEEEDKDEGKDRDARDGNLDPPPPHHNHAQHFPCFNNHLPVNSYRPSSATITLLALNLHGSLTIGTGNCFYSTIAEQVLDVGPHGRFPSIEVAAAFLRVNIVKILLMQYGNKTAEDCPILCEGCYNDLCQPVRAFADRFAVNSKFAQRGKLMLMATILQRPVVSIGPNHSKAQTQSLARHAFLPNMTVLRNLVLDRRLLNAAACMVPLAHPLVIVHEGHKHFTNYLAKYEREEWAHKLSGLADATTFKRSSLQPDISLGQILSVSNKVPLPDLVSATSVQKGCKDDQDHQSGDYTKDGEDLFEAGAPCSDKSAQQDETDLDDNVAVV
ncbi:uncharacterized protein JCM10292_005508 [Rhodotorula paludigena]|uniref:uncharacterized protein n=1 Tax=Rhodotorula paludigena TaxID=86838 RepID=UPI00317DC010